MHKLTIAVSLAFASLGLTGCTSTFFIGMEPQSHFMQPNSTVTPLGRVHGEASNIYFFMPNGGFKSEFKEDVIKQAIAQKPGANMLINYMQLWRSTTYIPLLIGTETYEVEGQAAKAVVSRNDSEE